MTNSSQKKMHVLLYLNWKYMQIQKVITLTIIRVSSNQQAFNKISKRVAYIFFPGDRPSASKISKNTTMHCRHLWLLHFRVSSLIHLQLKEYFRVGLPSILTRISSLSRQNLMCIWPCEETLIYTCIWMWILDKTFYLNKYGQKTLYL